MADKTKRVDGEDLTADCFLIVGDKEDTSTWKLPWKFSTDAKTTSHLRNALARFDQLEDVSDEDKKKAWAKLKKLCKEYGIDVSDDTGKSAGRFERKRRLRMAVKEISAAGVFSGLLSPYGNVDDGGDVVEKGAYTKTLQEHGNKVPLLWQHKADCPIGELTLEDRKDGLYCQGQLLMELPEAQKAYLLLKAQIVKGLSIGFETIKDSIESGVRHLKEVRLFEGSVVTFPMNELALITDVKARGGREVKGDFNEEFQERQLLDAGYQMRNALSDALCSALWADLTTEEKIAAAETVIQQFADAYLAYLPDYLELLNEMYGLETRGRESLETKSGRMISAANKEKIKTAHGHMQSAMDIMQALVDDEAVEDEDTSKSGAARETKSEPGNHSAILAQLKELKGVL